MFNRIIDNKLIFATGTSRNKALGSPDMMLSAADFGRF